MCTITHKMYYMSKCIALELIESLELSFRSSCFVLFNIHFKKILIECLSALIIIYLMLYTLCELIITKYLIRKSLTT